MDFYELVKDNLDTEQQKKLFEVEKWLIEKIQPIVNQYWLNDEFPLEIIPEIRQLDICQGHTDSLLSAFIVMEMARIEPSIATFYDIHSGLAMRSILVAGTENQKKYWIPQMQSLEKIGCFALTEPDDGSDISGGMKSTCKRHGDGWLLNGIKNWIGNATLAEIAIFWAKDVDDGNIRGFIVDNFKVEKIENKFGLKIVQNGKVTLNDVFVHEECRLNGSSFKDPILTILTQARYIVGCEATGCQMGAFEHALKYAKERKQFGKPIASFQLIQDLLVKILSNITACQCLCIRCAHLDQEGRLTPQQASMCKAFCTSKCRESVAWAREIFGGNGMSIDYNIGRYFTDAEALYSYEGTYQIQNLIIGKQITGMSAFV
jgi:glutaryl-CoA dehydrogenase